MAPHASPLFSDTGAILRTRTLAVALAVATAAAGLSLALAPTASAATSPADDFNGDLVVATPNAPVDGHADAGSVTVLYGSADGVSPARSTTLTQNSPGVPGDAGSHDLFGTSHAAGDLDADGYTDLVVGALGDAVPYSQSFGTLTVLWGGATGLTGDGISIASPLASSQWDAEKEYGKKVVVVVESLRPVRGEIRWYSERKAGIVFDEPLSFEELAEWIGKRLELASLKASYQKS